MRRSQSYDLELQRQRCKNLRRKYLRFYNKGIFRWRKNALAYYNAGVVAVN
jgi:hypothetical protein